MGRLIRLSTCAPFLLCFCIIGASPHVALGARTLAALTRPAAIRRPQSSRPAGSLPPVAAQCSEWSYADLPPGSAGYLYSVDAVASNDVWALGNNSGPVGEDPLYDIYDSEPSSLVVHYDGSAWKAAPAPGGEGDVFNAIAATSSNNVWVVGQGAELYFNSDHDSWPPLIDHFDGSGWAEELPYSLVPTTADLHGIAVVSSGDIWAVGDSNYAPFLEHYNGKTWRSQGAPVPKGESGTLEAISAINAHDIWAVGTSYGSETTAPLVEHFDGRRWSIVRSATPGSGFGELMSVAMTSPSNGWAVGYVPSSYPSGLLEHYNGKDWSVVTGPPGPQGESSFYSVSAASSRDVWVASPESVDHFDGRSWSVVAKRPSAYGGTGFYGVSALKNGPVWAVGHRASGQSLAVKFERGRQSVMSTPGAYFGAGSLNAVAGATANDVWAAGGTNFGSTLLERYDGKAWTIWPDSVPGQLYALAALSRDEVWAAGQSESGEVLIERFDGRVWSTVGPPPISGVVQSLAIVSSHDVWAVGGRAGYPPNTLVMHYDGKRWSIIPSPNATDGSGFLLSVAAVSPDDIWAVGGDNAPQDSLVEHYNGHVWSLVNAPNQGTLYSVAALPGNDLWAVGSVVLHYDARWSVASTPTQGDSASLDSVAAVSPSDVWAAGSASQDYTGDGDLGSSGYIEHFNGKKWSSADIAPGASDQAAGLSAIGVVAPKDLWAVGTYEDGYNGQTPAADRYSTLHCPASVAN